MMNDDDQLVLITTILVDQSMDYNIGDYVTIEFLI